jgi:hypothetical protein
VLALGGDGPWRIELLRARDVERLLLDQAGQLRLELVLLQPRRRQQLGQISADLRGVLGDGPQLAHVVGVAVPLAVAGAALRPHDHEHDEQDGERDQADEAE